MRTACERCHGRTRPRRGDAAHLQLRVHVLRRLQRRDGRRLCPNCGGELVPRPRRARPVAIGRDVDGARPTIRRRSASDEFVAAPEAAEDERIDVGVLFVGGGPAGLAGAIRLGPAAGRATRRRPSALGETPIALLDKGRVVGAHLLSGAVVNPSALRDLLPGRRRSSAAELRAGAQGVGVHDARAALRVRIPTPPPFHNKGNWSSRSRQLGRYLAEQAEELGVMVLPETDAQKLLVADGAVRGVRTGDKGLDRDRASRPAQFEPGAEMHAQATVLAEGTQGHLAGALIEHFGLQRARTRRSTRWASRRCGGCARPLDRVIHTLGWPLRASAQVRRERRQRSSTRWART